MIFEIKQLNFKETVFSLVYHILGKKHCEARVILHLPYQKHDKANNWDFKSIYKYHKGLCSLFAMKF